MRGMQLAKALLAMFMCMLSFRPRILSPRHQLKHRLNENHKLSRISVVSLDPGGMGGAELNETRFSCQQIFVDEHDADRSECLRLYLAEWGAEDECKVGC